MNDYQAYFTFSFITLCIGCAVFYASTVAIDSKLNYYIWGSLMCAFSLGLLIAGIYTKKEYKDILEYGIILDAVVRLRTESPETLQVNLVVTYILDGNEVTNMLLDSFNNDCPLHEDDRVKVRVYKGKAILVEELE